MSDSPDQHAPEPVAAPSINQTIADQTTSTSPPPSASVVHEEKSSDAALTAPAPAASPAPASSPTAAATPPIPNNEQSQPAGATAPAHDGDAPPPSAVASSAPEASSEPSKPEDKKDNGVPEPTSAPVVASAARVPTPSSRTSTPPLAHAKKKFSSVSVTKEFLSKAASPVPAPAKLVRPTAVAAPAQTTSKLLSSKLTTVPSSKPSTSPKPPAAGTAPASAPWAKTSLPPIDSLTPPMLQLQHPTPTRGMAGGLSNAAMGSGQGLGAAARRAWGTLGPNDGPGRRQGQPGGLAREFPTAKEVADGKRKAMLSAQAIAQAEAAHNQAILADLNVFTHLEPNAHRWDEEDEDDDMIDFGDGRTYSALSHAPEQLDQPVTKSERFGEDFDRSWPPKRDETRPRQDQGRVLFNASSNRLEPTHPRGMPTQSQATRVISREAPARPQERERALPPQLADSGRMLPPHMSSSTAPPRDSHAGARLSWRAPPGEREAPPHLSEHRDRDTHRPEPPARGIPARPPPAPRVAPPPMAPVHAPPPAAEPVAKPAPPPAPAPAAAPAAAPPAGETQAAEMHTAAEKARLRRLAEEAERDAAAERARQKARELAERFGPPKSAAPPAPTTAPAAPAPAPPSIPPSPPPGLSKAPHPPPGFPKPAPQITIAPRPKPEHGSPEATVGNLPQPPEQPPKGGAADRASSWRRTDPLPEPNARRPSQGDQGRMGEVRELRRSARDLPPHPLRDVPPHAQQRTMSSQAQDREEPPRSPKRPKAPPGLEPVRGPPGFGDHLPSPHPSKREANFDTMLARIQAAMSESRITQPDTKGSPHDSNSSEGMKDAADFGATQHEVAASMPAPAPATVATLTAPVEEPSKQSAPAPSRQKKVSPLPPTLPHLPPDYFDATQAEIPRSPPPAWRLYTVKLPKVSPPNRGSVPRSRLRAAEMDRSSQRGWAMTFDPALPQHAQSRLLADVLLPQPIGRRFAKQVETGPIVSISPRKLVMFQGKPKQRPAEPRTLPGDALSFGGPSRAVPESSQTEPSPVTPGPVRKPGRSARVAVPAPQTETALSSDAAKPPAVRFMVSSELDGDSLLDEVNKMSLEHIGEADDKGPAKVVDLGEKPGTPPPPSVPAPRNNPTSPSNAAPGPWAKSALAYPVTSPARDDPQREHLKSVWEQAADATASASTAPTSAPSQPETPLYPTLNSPATVPDPASLKPTYGAGQSAFGARGQFGQSYSQFMGSGATSPDSGGMGVQYGIMGRGGATNSNGFQQGLWAPSPSFGNSLSTAGYGGYGAKQHEQKSGSMGTFSNKDGQATYGNEFRYPNASQPAYQQAQSGSYNYAGAPAQFRAPQAMPQTMQQSMAQSVPQSVYGHVGGYGHTGFGTQMAGPRATPTSGHAAHAAHAAHSGHGSHAGHAAASRFPAMGNGQEYQIGYDPNSNYYSGQYQYGGANGSNGMEGRGGAVGRKMW